jgi:hypothetical protein
VIDRKAEFPNLEISVAAVTAEGWMERLADLMINDNNDDVSERRGKIILISPIFRLTALIVSGPTFA